MNILKIITLIFVSTVPIFLMCTIRFIIDLMRQYKGTRVKSNHSSHYIFSYCFSFSFILVFLLFYIFQDTTKFGIYSVELIRICNYLYSWSLWLITLTFAVAIIIAFTYTFLDEELNFIFIFIFIIILIFFILIFIIASTDDTVSPYHISSCLFIYKSDKLSKILLYKSNYFFKLNILKDFYQIYNIYIPVIDGLIFIFITYPYCFYIYVLYSLVLLCGGAVLLTLLQFRFELLPLVLLRDWAAMLPLVHFSYISTWDNRAGVPEYGCLITCKGTSSLVYTSLAESRGNWSTCKGTAACRLLCIFVNLIIKIRTKWKPMLAVAKRTRGNCSNKNTNELVQETNKWPTLFTSTTFLFTTATAPSRKVIILPPIAEEPEFTNPLDPDNIFGLQ